MEYPKNPALNFASALALLVCASAQAHATITFLNGYTGTASEFNSSAELAYQADVSSSDLINGLIPATTGWNTTNGANPSQLTDGIHGVSFASAGNNVQGGWSTTEGVAVFSLGAGVNGLGYNLSSIQTIAAWVNAGFGNQGWTIAVRPLGGSFTDLATINYQPLALSEGGATQVRLTSLNVTGIDSIRFTANQVNGGANGGAFVVREIDVFGTPTVPEPASSLLGLGGMALCLFRRRRTVAV